MEAQKRYALLTSLLLLSQGFLGTLALGNDRQGTDYTTEMLDAMQVLMTGEPEYDREFLAKLYPCMDSVNPLLKTASDLAWKGMVQYSDQNGVPGDEWGQCLGTGHCVSYFEQNATAMEYHNITIYEPCNYASNMVYYHLTTQICDRTAANEWAMPSEPVRALAETFSHLAMGSAFWHGSHTTLGNVFDNRVIEILAWISYQGYIGNLPNYDNPVVKDLQDEARPYTAIQISDQLTDMFLNKPVEEWTATIMGLNMPDYYMSFAAYVVSVLTLAVDEDTADNIILFLKELFSFPEDKFEFIYDKLMPELRNGTAGLDLTVLEKLHLEENMLSSLIKLIYAFIWQEWVITDNPMVFDPDTNARGAELIPVVNAFANGLNDFPIYDQNLQDGVHVYPGEAWCNPVYPHAKWHLEAAPGLTDFMFVGDQMYALTLALKP